MRHEAQLVGGTLVEEPLYDIRAGGRVVRCTMRVPARTPPQEGAKAGAALTDWLIANALVPRSGWLGVILDLRDGPSVIGPVSRANAERLFAASEQSRRPLAVLVSNSGAMFEQLSSLSHRCAPQCSTVTSDPAAAQAWMTRGVPPRPSSRQP